MKHSILLNLIGAPCVCIANVSSHKCGERIERIVDHIHRMPLGISGLLAVIAAKFRLCSFYWFETSNQFSECCEISEIFFFVRR